MRRAAQREDLQSVLVGPKQGNDIVCKLPGPEFSKQAGDMRVYFASSLNAQEEGGWVFAEAERAYAAVRFLGEAEATPGTMVTGLAASIPGSR